MEYNKNSRNDLLKNCEILAGRNSILEALDNELRKRGYAGPTSVPQLVFLSLYTRFFGKPVSLVIKGPSGCGKSFALQSGLQFIPGEAYESYSGMSEKALLYLKDLDLKHRYLVIGEAAGLAEGTGRAFLRQLLSEGKVRYATVQSTSDGLEGQELNPIEGPTGLILTTTANSLHPEDESRMLSYNLDESVERVRQALLNQALGLKSVEAPLDTAPWFALHDYVGTGDLSVNIPYSEALANKLPLTHFRVMRDFPQVLSLIRAHALMHQCTRDRGENGEVVANVDDYSAVYRLISEPLAQGLDNAVPEQIRSVVETVRALQGPTSQPAQPWETEGVSQVKIAEAIGRDRSVVSRNVQKAMKHGFLKNLAPGQGREARLVLGERELPSGSVLPEPEELQEEMKSKRKLELV